MLCRHSLRLEVAPVTRLEIVLIVICGIPANFYPLIYQIPVLEVVFLLVQAVLITIQAAKIHKMVKRFEEEKTAILERQKNGTRVVVPLLRQRKQID